MWVWEETGNVGKTFLADWLETWRQAYIVTGGKWTDIAHAFKQQEYVVFDFARSQEHKFPYELLEHFNVCYIYCQSALGTTSILAEIRLLRKEVAAVQASCLRQLPTRSKSDLSGPLGHSSYRWNGSLSTRSTTPTAQSADLDEWF